MTRAAERPLDLDLTALEDALRRDGFARIPGMLSETECAELVALYPDELRFRSRVVMRDHRFGEGEYRYFRYPLPALVSTLRETLYARLAPVATRLARELGRPTDYPAELEKYLARCHAAGQARPTPLLLSYGTGGFNRLHQDRYGELAFPLQATVFLSQRGTDFDGGEFLLHEQPARTQARVEVIPGERGEGVIFPSLERPVPGVRGPRRAAIKHGVARITRGQRYALGLIFHDAA